MTYYCDGGADLALPSAKATMSPPRTPPETEPLTEQQYRSK